MATVIAQGSGKSVTFAYDDQHQRIKQTLVNGTTTAVTTYLNDAASGAMSEKVVSASVTIWREYLLADGHIAAQHTTTSSVSTMWGAKKWNEFDWSSGAGATSSWQYFILDNLGSVAAVVDQTGALVEQDSYDAWGKRRNFTNGSDDPSGSIRSQTTRGFTGHEHIDDVGLINMNARIYDPQLGRFMTADPITATPYDAQSLNRYTYVDNRPLTLTDPTGLKICGPDASGGNASTQNLKVKDCTPDAPEENVSKKWFASDGARVDMGGVDAGGWSHTGNIWSPGGTNKADAAIGATDKGMYNGIGAALNRDGGWTNEMPIPPGVSVDDNMNLAATHKRDIEWFYNQVKGKGPWDYKQRGSQYENFGNFNYGATGRALGLSEGTLERMAGWAQVQAGTSRAEWGTSVNRVQALFGVGGSPPFGDDPNDQMWIHSGSNYYDAYGPKH